MKHAETTKRIEFAICRFNEFQAEYIFKGSKTRKSIRPKMSLLCESQGFVRQDLVGHEVTPPPTPPGHLPRSIKDCFTDYKEKSS